MQDTRALEALFFVSDEPITASVLAQALDVDRRTVEGLCDRLGEDLEDRGSGLVLRNVAGGWRLYTHPDTAPVVEQFVLSSRQARLTKAALETLSIVAYKQPVTRHQMLRDPRRELRRGPAGADGPRPDRGGRARRDARAPVLYGTTPGFLERLGLPSLASLPSLAPLLELDAEEATADDRRDATLDTVDLDRRRRPTRPSAEIEPGSPRRRPRLTRCPRSASSARWRGPGSARVEPASN